MNTLRLPASAEQVVVADSDAAVRTAVRAAIDTGQPMVLLGGGSNVILGPRIEGVVCLMRTRGLWVRSAGASWFEVTVAAGESWHGVVRRTLAGGLYGLENLAFIPGSAGAAPLQNIGAYGVELSDRLHRLRAVDRHTGAIVDFDNADCGFSYRDSRFKSQQPDRYVIVTITLRLSSKAHPVIEYPDIRTELGRLGIRNPTPFQVAQAVIRVRRRKLPDPRQLGNVGSFFKNPIVGKQVGEKLRRLHRDLVVHPAGPESVKLSAAQLIDLAGWKGVCRNAVGVWPRQPLVLVNYGAASAAAVLALAAEMVDDISRRFGVTLEMEPTAIACGHDVRNRDVSADHDASARP